MGLFNNDNTKGFLATRDDKDRINGVKFDKGDARMLKAAGTAIAAILGAFFLNKNKK